MTIHDLLIQKFGFQSFKAGQQEVIESILARQHTVAMLPTGTGKSLCYQLPGYLLDGVVLIVSPLLSLMQDQMEQMMARGEKHVLALNSFLDRERKQQALNELSFYKFIFISPEMLMSSFIISKLRRLNIGLLVVDEAHCISQWGHDFRPDYFKLGTIRQQLGEPLTLALTATATLEVRKDITESLMLEDWNEIIFSVDRPNIKLMVDIAESHKEKMEKLQNWVNTLNGSGIVYFSSKKMAEEAAEKLRKTYGNQVMAYHAGLEQESRVLIQQQFINGQLKIICATSAFGMGINKSDVRYVIHFHMPAQMEAYVQEIGRAGRDGQDSLAILMYAPYDENIPLQLMENELPSDSQLKWLFSLCGDTWNQTNWIEMQKDVKVNGGFTDVGFRMVTEYVMTIEEGADVKLELTKFMDVLSQKRQTKRQKITNMISWIKENSCKREKIINYFQEQKTKDTQNCCVTCGLDFEPFLIVSTSDDRTKPTYLPWKKHLTLLLTKSGLQHEK